MNEQNTISNLEKGYSYLELKQWKNASDMFDLAIVNGENKSEAYIGRLLAKLKLTDFEALVTSKTNVTKYDDYKLAVKYADEEYKNKLQEYGQLCNERNVRGKTKVPKLVKLTSFCIAALIALSSLTYFLIIPYGRYLGYRAALSKGDVSEVIKSYTNSNWFEYDKKFHSLLYDYAEAYTKNGEYQNSINCYNFLGDYKDSENKLVESKYGYAIHLYESKNYSQAIEIFEELLDHEDSKDYIKEINQKNLDAQYQDAVDLYNSKKYIEAIEKFKDLNGYLDSADYLKKDELYYRQIGCCVEFGNYEQDNNLSNGKEPIEWYIIDSSNESTEVLLISKYVLDYVEYLSLSSLRDPYNQTPENPDLFTTWEKCDLRKWLNNDFYNTAFTASEKTGIVQMNVANPSGEPSGVIDNVTVLSKEEVKKYISDAVSRCTYTKYANTHRHLMHDEDYTFSYEAGESADWVLRKMASNIYVDVCIDHYGDWQIQENGGLVVSPVLGVRPIIKVNISNLK